MCPIAMRQAGGVPSTSLWLRQGLHSLSAGKSEALMCTKGQAGGCPVLRHPRGSTAGDSHPPLGLLPLLPHEGALPHPPTLTERSLLLGRALPTTPIHRGWQSQNCLEYFYACVCLNFSLHFMLLPRGCKRVKRLLLGQSRSHEVLGHVTVWGGVKGSFQPKPCQWRVWKDKGSPNN